MIERIFLVFLALSVSGCSYIIDVTMIGSDTLKPQFSVDSPNLLRPPGADVRAIMVCDVIEDRANCRDPLWHLKSDGVWIKKVSYGVVPNKFEQLSPPGQLLEGQTYEVIIQAWGGSGGFRFTASALNNTP